VDRVIPSITNLEALVAGLPAAERQRFERIYHVVSSVGYLKAPAAMRPWVERQFGSVAAVEEQHIVKVTNRVVLEGALFNPLRASRPMDVAGGDLAGEIAASRGDPFCQPETGTPEDVFGRVRGRLSISASNVAKSDGLHGLIIFDEHDPLALSEPAVLDYFNVALKWAKEAHNVDRSARYFFMLWNCLWKAGASIVHGHAQMTLSKGMHYPRIEGWRRAGQLYRLGYGANYFQDLISVHTALGLARPAGSAQILVNLAPIKEKELLVIGERPDADFCRAVYLALDALLRRLGTRSFSLALYWRPLDGVEEDWSGFPTIARIVDRGDPFSRTADIGAMELYAASVVSADPFAVAAALRG
jgi:hypothetical protein